LLAQGICLPTLLQLARQYVCLAPTRSPLKLLAVRRNFWVSHELSFSEAHCFHPPMLNPLFFDSLLLGIQHSFEPDHMAAVAVLATEQKQGAGRLWRVIWRSSHWALGHSLTLIVFASLVILLKSKLSLHIAAQVELAIGPLMIWLGVLAIRRNFAKPKPLPAKVPSPIGPPTGLSRSFWVGMVHGLAGTGGACTIALTLAARDATAAVWIIVLQSAGILVSMTTYGCLFAFSATRFSSRWQPSLKLLNYVVGAFSIAIGVYTLVESVQGLG
jgi:nickel/cobalt exporter